MFFMYPKNVLLVVFDTLPISSNWPVLRRARPETLDRCEGIPIDDFRLLKNKTGARRRGREEPKHKRDAA